MADSRVTIRYVKSLLGLAVEQGALEKVHQDMVLLDSVCVQNKAFSSMLRSPIIKHDKKREILNKVFGKKVHPLTLAIFDIITKKNREPLLPSIASSFHQAYNDHKGIQSVSITTTVPLDKTLQEAVEKIVKKFSTQKEIELVKEVDPGLIGGFVLKIGDRQLDASLRSKLNDLKVKLSYNPYIKAI